MRSRHPRKPLNIVVIADTDLLVGFHVGADSATSSARRIAQPFANNGELVWNALDNLAGSADLISIRGRARLFAAVRSRR